MFGGSLMELKLQSFNRLLLEFLFKLCLQPHVKEIGEHSIHSIMKNSLSPSRAVDLVYVFLNMQL